MVKAWQKLGKAMAKAWCITKANGPMFVGMPSSHTDSIAFNAHRIYGPKRWPHLMARHLLQLGRLG